MADAEQGAGDIPIELDGKEMFLVPSLQACLTISKIGGGLNAAVQRCLNLDFDTICQIVTAGLSLNQTQAKMVPDAVYKTGLIGLSAPCIDFINVVGNGGRPVEIDGEGGEGGDADPPKPVFP
jgi:hypothetical protein